MLYSLVTPDLHNCDWDSLNWFCYFRIKAHYGDTYRREHEFRKRKERFENMKKSSSEDHLQSSTSYAVMGFFCATFYLIMLILVSENKHDRVIIKNDKEKWI